MEPIEVDLDVFSSISAVTGQPDLWSAILQQLPLLDLNLAAATCQAHLALKDGLTRRIKHLGVCLVPGPKPSDPMLSTMPRVCLLPAETVDPFLTGQPRSPPFDDRASILDGRGFSWPILPRVTALFPHITHLVVDLTTLPPAPNPELEELERHRGDSRGSIEPPSSCLDDLASLASFLHVKRPGSGVAPPPWQVAKSGPEPWVLLPARRLTHLAMTCERMVLGSPPGRCSVVAVAALRAIFLSCTVASQSTLVHLDLTGLAPAVLLDLLTIDLPRLQLLRVGVEVPSTKTWEEAWPADILSTLSAAFPTLTALDVGYADVADGVSYNEVERLCDGCPRLRHLDLSMVMTYRDFSPCLLTLSRKAPHLTSLAIHGLQLQASGLEAFAEGCPLLTRLHFVRCMYTAQGLLGLLRKAHRLQELDLSLGNLDEDVELLEEWLEEKAANPSSGAQLRRVFGTTVQSLPETKKIKHVNGVRFVIDPAEWRDVSTADLRSEGLQLLGDGDEPTRSRVWFWKAIKVRVGAQRLFHHLGSASLAAHGDEGVHVQPWLGKRHALPFERDFAALIAGIQSEFDVGLAEWADAAQRLYLDGQ